MAAEKQITAHTAEMNSLPISHRFRPVMEGSLCEKELAIQICSFSPYGLLFAGGGMVGSLIEISDFDCTRVERKTSMLFHVNTDTMAERQRAEKAIEILWTAARNHLLMSADVTHHLEAPQDT